MGTKYVLNATKIELDVNVPEEEFNIPGDIKFTETVFSPDEMMMDAAEEGEEASDEGNESVPDIKSFKELKGLLKKGK
jgi:hypothetical protein